MLRSERIAVCVLTAGLLQAGKSAEWPMRQRDVGNTGRASFSVPGSKLGTNFFKSLLWQKPTPWGGSLSSSAMVFYDGVGPEGADLVAAGYHWPKGVQGMDRHTGKFFWAGNPDGGESIGAITPAFSPDGQTVYVANDATPHPLMAFAAAVGPAVYWHNGADPNPGLLGNWSPKVAPDGRIFSHAWCDHIGAATDDGAALHLTWSAASGVCSCMNGPALLVETNRLLVVSGGRCGVVKAFNGSTGVEVWSVNVPSGTDADATVDPVSGNTYLPVGYDSVHVMGVNKLGQPLWSSVTKRVYEWRNGENNPQRAQSAGCLSHDGSTFYFQTVSQQGDGRLYAVSTLDGSLKWSFNTGSQGWEGQYSSPIVTSNSVVVVGNNAGGAYFALRDTGSAAHLLDTLPVATGGNAASSATMSPDGVLYLPARLNWVQSNGDNEAPSQQPENLFNAFDVRGTPGTALASPSGLQGNTLNRTVELAWQAIADPGGQFAYYAIYRSTTPFSSIAGRTPVASVSNLSMTQFVDRSVLNAKPYYYAVTVVSWTGGEAEPLIVIGPLTPSAPQWGMRQRDVFNTGRADFSVPAARLSDTFFNAPRWQKRTPSGGPLSSSTMVFYDGVGPNGADLIVGGYHWPKGVQGMDRQTGKFFWAANPDGGESIGAITPAFSPDGRTVYVANDATSHPLMAFGTVVGPSVYWHNGADPNPGLLGNWSPKVAPDGRIFSHSWNDRPYGAVDDGTKLALVWSASSSVCACISGPAMIVQTGQVSVVSGGRCGSVASWDGTSGAELWRVETGLGTDADATVDPISGNIYLPAGWDTIYVVGLSKAGNPLWSTTAKQIYQWQDGLNNPQGARSAGCLSHDGSTFYFQTVSAQGDGRLYAVNTADGALKWSFNTGSKGAEGRFSSPVVTPNGVIVVGNNEGGVYYALRDTGSAAQVLDTLPVVAGASAFSSATISPDGLLYLPARLNWVQSNGDNETPSQQAENLFNAFDLNAVPQITLPPPPGQRGHRQNGAVLLMWNPVADPAGQFSHYAIYRSTTPFTSLSGLVPLAAVSNRLANQYLDQTVANGTIYYYFVASVSVAGLQAETVTAIGPMNPVDETDLQVVCISRTPRFPRYDPIYTYYEVTEPSGFGPYGFTAATGLGSGQTTNTARWPAIGEAVTYTASIRNRGTNPWTNNVPARWQWDGVTVTNMVVASPLAPGATVTFAFTHQWDGQSHDVRFELLQSDARTSNNDMTINTKSVPFLTYIDETFHEQFISTTRLYTNAATDDLIDWLNRHMRRFNQMFAESGCQKRVHYDVLEVIPDSDPDPDIPVRAFAIFPFRYTASQGGDTRLSGYYSRDDDIDYGLLHEMGHQLGLIDLYQMDIWPEANQVSGLTYFPWEDLMRICSPFLSASSALGMNRWLDQVHGYFGQYLYGIPSQVGLRVLDTAGKPLAGAVVKMYQLCERPGVGKIISNQVKAQGTTDVNGVWMLPNVPVDPSKVPPVPTGDLLHDNPFGYVAVVGGNGVLHFKIEAGGMTNFAWLGIIEANTAYYGGQTNQAIFDRQWSASGVANPPMMLGQPQVSVSNGVVHVEITGGAPYVPVVVESSADLKHWVPVATNTPLNGVMEFTEAVAGRFYRFYRAKQ